MKKLISLFALTVPLLCFGMEEPSGSSSNPGFESFRTAIASDNMPLLRALTLAGIYNNQNDPLAALGWLTHCEHYDHGRPTGKRFSFETYTELASILCPTCDEQSIKTALEEATRNADSSADFLEKTQFLLEQAPQKPSKESLNEALQSLVSNNPLYVPCMQAHDEKKAEIIKELLTAGAEFSPGIASLALQKLTQRNALRYSALSRAIDAKNPLLFASAIFCGPELCSPERRALMRILKEREAQAPACTGNESCGAYCDSLITGANTAQVHDICQLCRTMDGEAPLVLCVSSMAGTLGTVVYPQATAACCCLLCAAQALPSSQAIQIYKTALQTQPVQQAVPMDADPERQPALLTNNQ